MIEVVERLEGVGYLKRDLGWTGEKALERMVGERIKRFSARGRKFERSERRLIWYELGFRDGWEQCMNEMKKREERS